VQVTVRTVALESSRGGETAQSRYGPGAGHERSSRRRTPAIRETPKIIASDPIYRPNTGCASHASKTCLLKRSRDLNQSSDSVEVRVLATIALRGIIGAWNAWYRTTRRRRHQRCLDLDKALGPKADYLKRLLEAGCALMASLSEAEP
jgi:hypothetical protein